MIQSINKNSKFLLEQPCLYGDGFELISLIHDGELYERVTEADLRWSSDKLHIQSFIDKNSLGFRKVQQLIKKMINSHRLTFPLTVTAVATSKEAVLILQKLGCQPNHEKFGYWSAMYNTPEELLAAYRIRNYTLSKKTEHNENDFINAGEPKLDKLFIENPKNLIFKKKSRSGENLSIENQSPGFKNYIISLTKYEVEACKTGDLKTFIARASVPIVIDFYSNPPSAKKLRIIAEHIAEQKLSHLISTARILIGEK